MSFPTAETNHTVTLNLIIGVSKAIRIIRHEDIIIHQMILVR